MTHAALANTLAPDADGFAPLASRAGRPWREIGLAVAFHLLALVFAVGAVAIYAFILVLLKVRLHWSIALLPMGMTFLLMVLMQVAIVWMAIARARTLGGGNPIIGLAAGPIPRSRLFTWVVIAEVAYFILCVAWLRGSPIFYQSLQAWTDRQLLMTMKAGPIWVTGYAINIVILAPLYEELVFRGWLWTALRRSWGAGSTALVTSGLWLLLHVPQGLTKVVLLVPLALILSAVRHRTGSVRATLVVHALNNARAVLLPLAAAWYS